MKLIPECPNPTCSDHGKPNNGNIIHKGYASVKTSKTNKVKKRNPRYICKTCKKYFRNSVVQGIGKQKRPDINKEIFSRYTSRESLNNIAKEMGITKTTIIRKIDHLAVMCFRYHTKVIEMGLIKTDHVQFDEMETYEHTKLAPLTMPMAVDVASGRIIDIRFGTIKAHGPKISDLAKIHPNPKYSKRINMSQLSSEIVLRTVRQCLYGDLEVRIYTDKKTSYSRNIKEVFKGCNFKHRKVKARYIKIVKEISHPRMALFNSRATWLRNNCSRLSRDTWATTKDPIKLQRHMWMLIAKVNRYDLKKVLAGKTPDPKDFPATIRYVEWKVELKKKLEEKWKKRVELRKKENERRKNLGLPLLPELDVENQERIKRETEVMEMQRKKKLASNEKKAKERESTEEPIEDESSDLNDPDQSENDDFGNSGGGDSGDD
jgi:hypothetical protein